MNPHDRFYRRLHGSMRVYSTLPVIALIWAIIALVGWELDWLWYQLIYR